MVRTKTKEPFDQVIFISDVHFGKGNIEKLQIIKDYFDKNNIMNNLEEGSNYENG